MHAFNILIEILCLKTCETSHWGRAELHQGRRMPARSWNCVDLRLIHNCPAQTCMHAHRGLDMSIHMYIPDHDVYLIRCDIIDHDPPDDQPFQAQELQEETPI